MDDRRLREITPGRRGWRFVGKIRGLVVRANVPYLVVTAAGVTTRHYTEAGAKKRVAILRTSGVKATAWGWSDDGWRLVVRSGWTRSHQLV